MPDLHLSASGRRRNHSTCIFEGRKECGHTGAYFLLQPVLRFILHQIRNGKIDHRQSLLHRISERIPGSPAKLRDIADQEGRGVHHKAISPMHTVRIVMIRNQNGLIRGGQNLPVPPPVFPGPACGLSRTGNGDHQTDIRPELPEKQHGLGRHGIKTQGSATEKGTDSLTIRHFQAQRNL